MPTNNVAVIVLSGICGLFLGFVSAGIIISSRINGEYEGFAYPFFMLGTAVIDGIYGLVVAGLLIGFARNSTGRTRQILFSCLSGFLRATISAIMIYNRTTYGDRGFSGLPSWWYSNQLKVLVLDFFVGFFIAFFTFVAIKFLTNAESKGS